MSLDPNRHFPPSDILQIPTFTAEFYGQKFGLPIPVVQPIVPAWKYRTEVQGRSILFVNPHPLKGLERALELARICPEISFIFQLSWPLSPFNRLKLALRCAPYPNVRVAGRVLDMRPTYAQTKALIVPSICQEAWGRVVSEAQHSGIPALANKIGGLPESVGSGGVLLDPNCDVEDWARELRRLWEEPEHHRRLSEAALKQASSPDLTPAHLAKHFLTILRA